MEEIAKQLANKWKEIIESISVDGYSRKVESTDCIRMTKFYTGYPEIEWCYKVIFNFHDGISYIELRTQREDIILENKKSRWHEKLQKSFTEMFWEPATEVMPEIPKTSNMYYQMNVLALGAGEVKFENSRVDYMTDQGYRFIIQFYPAGFLSSIRNSKLKELGI